MSAPSPRVRRATTNGNGHGISRATKLDDLPDLITVEELATWLGVGRNTAYALLARGEVKSIRLGRLVRIPKSALAELAR
jgi:excisionase family DNA binding protein